MRRRLIVTVLGCAVVAGLAAGGASAQPPPAPAAAPAAAAPPTEEAKLLAAVRDALERNAREIADLKQQYAKDMEAQRKTVASQQEKIATLERTARAMEEQLKRQAPAAPAQLATEVDRQKALNGLQQKQIEILEEQSQLAADHLNKQGPAVEKVQSQAATLESRAAQAARRDQTVANADDILKDTVDAQQRAGPRLPAPLKQLFLPSGTNVTPFTIFNTISTIYNVPTHRKGAGTFAFQEYTPFLLVQLNNRIFLNAETSFTQGGVALGQAQVDIFINNWLTADVGYFLAPVGFWNEALDPRWINKLPDVPLVMRQVIPDGLTITGLQFRGAAYLLKSPFKLEYSVFMTNGLGVPGQGAASDWADLGATIGTTGGVNQAMAYGGRLSLRIPTRGIQFGISEFSNSPYSRTAGAAMTVWDPYFNYHRGNWDFRFEYGNNYEVTRPFIKTNIHREGLYAQVAYRDYASLHQHLQRLECVFRYSDAIFHGIDQRAIKADTFDPPTNAPVDRDQFTLGVNYYFYATSILKVAYEINRERDKSFLDNIFIMQFVTNF